MNNYPKFAKVGDKKYKINTDFRIALECNRIAMDEKIGINEKSLAIIYKLFGDKGLFDNKNHLQLLELAFKYLKCGRENDEEDKNKKIDPDMDFEEDKGYIASSFKYDYGYNPYNLKYLHYYEFYNDLCNLSNDEFGQCCVLSKIRNLRNLDLKTIKDPKERKKMEKAKERVSLQKNQNKKMRELTIQEKNNVDEFMKLAGIERK